MLCYMVYIIVNCDLCIQLSAISLLINLIITIITWCYHHKLMLQVSHKLRTHALIPYSAEGDLSGRFYSCLDLTKGTQLRLHRKHNSKVSSCSACLFSIVSS